MILVTYKDSLLVLLTMMSSIGLPPVDISVTKETRTGTRGTTRNIKPT